VTAEALPLLYPARLNSLFGESGGGKSWVAFAAVLEVIRRGRRALVLDWEDGALGIVERLDLLGVTPAEIALVDYRNPATGLMRGVEHLEATITDPIDLIVIDSVGEAMAAGGVNSNDDAEVAVWFNLARRLTRLPGSPAVVLLDHIPKANDAPQLYSIGSQRKRAAINGASYRIDTLREPAQERDGKWKLTVAKDRIGNRAKGTTAAIVDVTSTADRIELYFHLTDAQEAEAKGERFRPTVLMERVSRYLEEHPGASGRNIIDDVPGKTGALREAVAALIDERHVEVENGPRGALWHHVVNPYRELHDLTATHRDPPRPDRDPSRSEDPHSDRDPVPPPLRGTGRGHEGSGPPQTTPTATPDGGIGADDPPGPVELPF
jgi:hypothetical protein